MLFNNPYVSSIVVEKSSIAKEKTPIVEEVVHVQKTSQIEMRKKKSISKS